MWHLKAGKLKKKKISVFYFGYVSIWRTVFQIFCAVAKKLIKTNQLFFKLFSCTCFCNVKYLIYLISFTNANTTINTCGLHYSCRIRKSSLDCSKILQLSVLHMKGKSKYIFRSRTDLFRVSKLNKRICIFW